MKKVFSSHSMVAHVWAQQTQEHGRGKNMFFEGPAIYSWGKHWPIAFFIDQRCPRLLEMLKARVIVNTESRSVSTRQHTGEVTGALHGLHGAYRIDDCRLVSELIHIQSDFMDAGTADERMIEAICDYHLKKARYYATRVTELLEKYKSYKKSPAKFREALGEERDNIDLFNKYREYASAWYKDNDPKQTCPQEHDKLWKELNEYIRARDEAKEAAKEKKRQERERVLQEMREKTKDAFVFALDAWRRGIPSSDMMYEERQALHYHMDDTTRVCYKNGKIHTSRGADVPLEHAKHMIKMLKQAIREKENRPYSPSHLLHPHVRVGHFTVETVDLEQRTIKIGCHTLTFDEINDFIDFAKEHHPELKLDDGYKLP